MFQIVLALQKLTLAKSHKKTKNKVKKELFKNEKIYILFREC
jgi:hypothetical protein